MILTDQKLCKECGKTFNRPLVKGINGKTHKISITLWSVRIYCSRKCSELNNKNNNAAKNTKHGSWKGQSVGYHGLHRWIRRHFGRPNSCEHCGILNEKEGMSKIHYASKDNLYTRLLKDWIKLCAKCHKAYDMGRIEI